jgi:hypothetical protein
MSNLPEAEIVYSFKRNLFEKHWPDLGTLGTRSHAVDGARMLGVVGFDDQLTPEGATAVYLLMAVGFDPNS